VSVNCPRCGALAADDARFCAQCGEPLKPTAARTASREERKVVSVLFADLVGFTSQAEAMDPEEVRALLQPYHASLRADLERWSGTVEKFIGDAVMALFGAPVAREDDPERAVRAALAIRDTVSADGRLHVRIGITTGEALVALEARPESGEGMASGDVVNTAARLQAAAPVDGILVDDATWRATSRVIEYRDHEAISAKGKAVPVSVHEVVAARSRFGVDVRGGSGAPLVGRGRELEILFGAFERASAAREPQLVTIAGVPGIGKSRLVWELFHHIDTGTQLVRWRQGRALAYAEGISYWALGEIVKAEAGILETDAAEETAAKLSRAVALVGDPADAPWFERHLGPLVGLESGSEFRGDHRGEAFTAWTRYLEALADQRPLVLAFEDLHWADEGLLDFVDHLVDWAGGVPMLIVATARPELLSRRPGWGGGKPNALTISLAPLSDAETGSLVAALVEQAIIPNAMREAVLERAQGNPLYAEEFARLVAERGTLDDLPESVLGIVAARLDTLAREDKELLQDAAVAGKVFWSGTLVHMRDRSLTDVEERLHGLERREFIRRDRRSSVAGESEYAFRHILVRDVAYNQIPRGERAERHVLAARWLESLGRPADHAELLANHYLAAIELARVAGRSSAPYAESARLAFRRAGDHASALNAFAAAARYYRAALELWPAEDAERPAILFGLGKALRISQESGADVLAEAEKALLETGDRATAAEAAVLQAELAWFAGDGESTAGHLARASDLVEGLPQSFSKAFVLSDLSRYHMLASRYADAIAVGREALAIADSMDLDEIRVHALDNVGIARVMTDDRGGLDDLEASLGLARRINSLDAPRAMNNLGVAYEATGDLKRARPLWREALTLARELGVASIARFAQAQMPSVLFSEGDWDEAVRVADQIIGEAEAGQPSGMESSCRDYRARIRLARGDLDGARQDAERGVELARRSGDPQSMLPLLASAAYVAYELGSRERAAELAGEAVEHPEITNTIRLELVLTLLELDRQADAVRVAKKTPAGAWRDVMTGAAERRPADAADASRAYGAMPATALLDFEAARAFAREGRDDDARARLELAVAFWESVGATYFLAKASSLEATLAPATKVAGRRAAVARRARRS
jgi:class 3 adenylate cyclase/tetratricopeptide (TPR) repeat protein